MRRHNNQGRDVLNRVPNFLTAKVRFRNKNKAFESRLWPEKIHFLIDKKF